MKLESVEIHDFRGVDNVSVSFTDELGRVQPRSLIVGPNASGKTSALDAIALCLQAVTGLDQPRPGLSMTPSSVVRRGAANARVRCTVRFPDDEIDAVTELFERVGNPYEVPVPRERVVQVHWEYPDRLRGQRKGAYHTEPPGAWTLFRGRLVAGRHLHVPGVSPLLFRRLGGVFLFDQQRTSQFVRVGPRERALVGQGVISGWDDNGSAEESGAGAEGATDPRLLLLSLAVRAQAQQDPETTEQEDYRRLRELYASVCHPHRIGDLYNTENGLDLEFIGERGPYRFDGLSSGQQMVLLLLLQFARKHIHRSVVLLDELELHLQPLWQDRLYESLGSLGIDNQFVLTTHSTHLRDSIQERPVLNTGKVAEEKGRLGATDGRVASAV